MVSKAVRVIVVALFLVPSLGAAPTTLSAESGGLFESVGEANVDEAGNVLDGAHGVPSAPLRVISQAAPPLPAPGCNDNDIQTSATADSSGGGLPVHGYGPELANDGFLGPPESCDFHWLSAASAPSGAWYRLTWPQEMTICQIFVDTKPYWAECGVGPNRILSDAKIQWWDGLSWVNAGQVSKQTDDWDFVFPSCVVTTQLRLFDVYTDPAPGQQASNPVLYELKVYGCSVCGNGEIESGEQCDDGNLLDGDGCSADCLIEPLDHFKCYKAKDLKNPKFEAQTVTLADQFAVNDGSFEVKKPFLMCNPTDKNGEGITDQDDHLTCYKIKGPKLDKNDRPHVEVVNQLGTVQLEAKKPFLLCVPSAKTVLP